jgi:hypothetical protein
MTTIYPKLKKRFLELCRQNELLDEQVDVRARVLTTEEALGHPEDDDFPLQKGKERLMQADFRGGSGQAFTDRFGDFRGTLKEILDMPLENNYRRAVFVAALNATLRSLSMIKGTIHCRDQEPTDCAEELAGHIRRTFGQVKITQIGFQPRMAQKLAADQSLRLLDLDPVNIGTDKFGVTVEGPGKTDEAVQWADVLLVTGTTLVNDTIGPFLTGKPVIFYGTTIAGAACLMGWERFCAKSQ